LNRLWIKGTFTTLNGKQTGTQAVVHYVQINGKIRVGDKIAGSMQINQDLARVQLVWDGSAWVVEESPDLTFLPLGM